MPFSIEPVTDDQLVQLTGLLNVDIDRVYPFRPVDDIVTRHLLADSCKPLRDVAVLGAFRDNHLCAAAKVGEMPPDADPMDCANVLPGDDVIVWMVFDDDGAADELLRRLMTRLGQRIYAFPDFSGLKWLSAFHTGMLPLGRRRLTSFFESYGFKVPEGETWGPQDRVCYRLALTDAFEVPPLPVNFCWERSGKGLSYAMKLMHGNGSEPKVAGECSMSPAVERGIVRDNAVFISWLGVNSEFRSNGLGGTLLKAMLNVALENGAVEAYLTTHAGRPAWRLYERIGFEKVCRARSYVLER